MKLFDSPKLTLREIFSDKVLPKFPSLFGKWFSINFINQDEWYQSKLLFTKSLATMSIVGAILGLGDRHGENIMIHENTGEVMHVDFNCLFEKGLKFAKPEKVPFRLTHNLEHALGLLGHSGILIIFNISRIVQKYLYCHSSYSS